jgi:hypothetical protein
MFPRFKLSPNLVNDTVRLYEVLYQYGYMGNGASPRVGEQDLHPITVTYFDPHCMLLPVGFDRDMTLMNTTWKR